MIDLQKLKKLRRQGPSALLGLALDGARLDGVVLKRSNGALQLQQSPLIAGLHELGHQTRCRRKGNREALLTGRQSEAQPNMRLARAGVAERDDVVAA